LNGPSEQTEVRLFIAGKLAVNGASMNPLAVAVEANRMNTDMRKEDLVWA
jgi:hypothetical protein